MLSNRRGRRVWALLILSAGLFGLLASVAHACGDDVAHGWGAPLTGAAAGGTRAPQPPDEDAGCTKSFGDHLPLVAAIRPFQDSPGGQPFATGAMHGIDAVSLLGSPLQRSTTAHPFVDVPLAIRFLRLTL